MIINGRVRKFGDNIDTDVIIPGRYLSITDPKELAQHIFEGVYPSFVSSIRPGDVIVAGKNFGSGSSREHAPIGIKAAGISAVVAESFARIFYRNAINVGLMIFISPEASRTAREGDKIVIDTEKGVIKLEAQNGEPKGEYQVEPFPPFLQEIMSAGGLVNWVRNELKKRGLNG